MPKRTYKDLEKLHSVTRHQLNAARAKGVNVWNDAECADYFAKSRKRVGKKAKIPEKTPAAVAQDIEAIKLELAKATDYETVKILSEKLKGLQTAVRVQRDTRELIPLDEVESRDVRIAAAVKAGVLKLCNDAAPMVEGLDAAKAHKVLMDQGTHVLEMMADEQSEFWREVVR